MFQSDDVRKDGLEHGNLQIGSKPVRTNGVNALQRVDDSPIGADRGGKLPSLEYLYLMCDSNHSYIPSKYKLLNPKALKLKCKRLQ